jgi:hypothetical protein
MQMSTERYVGERRALWHFLSELQPLVIASLGEDALLRHRIDRSLRSGDLEQLRLARRMFHHLPEDLKRRLMRGIVDGSAADASSSEREPADPFTTATLATASPADAKHSLAADPKRSTTIRFSAFPAARDEDIALSVDLDDEEVSSSAPVQVMIEPGTLPRSAAETLRQIANWIEHDRRLLSTQHWVRSEKGTTRSDETMDQA